MQLNCEIMVQRLAPMKAWGLAWYDNPSKDDRISDLSLIYSGDDSFR